MISVVRVLLAVICTLLLLVLVTPMARAQEQGIDEAYSLSVDVSSMPTELVLTPASFTSVSTTEPFELSLGLSGVMSSQANFGPQTSSLRLDGILVLALGVSGLLRHVYRRFP